MTANKIVEILKKDALNGDELSFDSAIQLSKAAEDGTIIKFRKLI